MAPNVTDIQQLAGQFEREVLHSGIEKEQFHLAQYGERARKRISVTAFINRHAAQEGDKYIQEAVEYARQLAPKATGFLSSTIRGRRRSFGEEGIGYYLSSSASYAAHVEFGTLLQDAQPFIVPAMQKFYQQMRKHLNLRRMFLKGRIRITDKVYDRRFSGREKITIPISLDRAMSDAILNKKFFAETLGSYGRIPTIKQAALNPRMDNIKVQRRLERYQQRRIDRHYNRYLGR